MGPWPALLLGMPVMPARPRHTPRQPRVPRAATDKPVRGGTVTEAIQENPNHLLPGFSGSLYTLLVQQTIFAPLFYSDDHGNIQPGLASVVPTVKNGGISPDGKTYTFHLRRGLRWSDGTPLTARDVDFSWRLWTNRKVSPQPYSTLGIDRIGGASISADGLTITFFLVQPFAPFLSEWTDRCSRCLPMCTPR